MSTISTTSQPETSASLRNAIRSHPFTKLLGPFSLPNYAGFLFVAIASTFLYTWIFNHTKGSVLIATLTHGCSDASGSLLVLLIPAHLIISRWAQPFVHSSWQAINVIIFDTSAILLLILTRSRLGYNPERNAQIIDVPLSSEPSLSKVG